MQSLTHEDALRVFEAFLLYARGGAAPPQALLQAQPKEPTFAPPPIPPQEPAPAPVVRGSRVSQETTRVSPLSEALASSLSPLPMYSSTWEEPTRERPDVVRELVSDERNLSDTQQSLPVFAEVSVGHPVAQEDSIIVEDEGLTHPEFDREPFSTTEVQTPAAGLSHVPMPVEQFVQEMSVLIKYGHSGQAARETERWIGAHPDDLSAHLKIAEFEMARLDRDAAVNRFVALIARLLERGDQAGAADLVQKLRRDAPDDLRIGVLAQRYGR